MRETGSPGASLFSKKMSAETTAGEDGCPCDPFRQKTRHLASLHRAKHRDSQSVPRDEVNFNLLADLGRAASGVPSDDGGTLIKLHDHDRNRSVIKERLTFGAENKRKCLYGARSLSDFPFEVS